MNNPVKVQPLYNPAQGKPPNVERFSSTMCIIRRESDFCIPKNLGRFFAPKSYTEP